MRRSSSRPRLVSWDAFDATEHADDDRSETSGGSLSGYETSCLAVSSNDSNGSSSDSKAHSLLTETPLFVTEGDFPFLKRKRTTISSNHSKRKEEPLPVLVEPLSTSKFQSKQQQKQPPQQSLRTVSSDSSFVTAVSTTSSLSLSTVASIETDTDTDTDLSSEPAIQMEPNVNVNLITDPTDTDTQAKSFLSLCADVQMHIFTFLDVNSIRNTMQINHRTRNLLLSEDSETLWNKHCSRQWNWLDLDVDSGDVDTSVTNTNSKKKKKKKKHCHVTVLQDALKLPTAAGTSSPFCNLSLLLSLASKNMSHHVDESIFMPCRWSRSLRRYMPRRPTAGAGAGPLSQVRVLLKTVQTVSGEAAVQFIGAVGQGDRCIRGDQPLPRPQVLVPVGGSTDNKNNNNSDMNRPGGQKETAQWQRTLSAGRGRAFLSRIRNRGRGHARDSNSSSSGSSRSSSSSSSSNRSSSGSSGKSIQTKGLTPLKTSPTNNWRPFVAPFCTAKSEDNNGATAVVMELAPRLISYFEVSILEPPAVVSNDLVLRTPSTPPMIPNNNASECVAVGLASHDFSLHTRMPGWDPNSFGYHGDDGGIFHASGSMVQHYGPTYGVGDVVGCGIDYIRGHIFYTLNGKYLGPAFFDLSAAVLQQDWFPVVGLDSNCLVQCNFGCDKPFCFDLSQMIQEQKERLVQGITTLPPKPIVSSS